MPKNAFGIPGSICTHHTFSKSWEDCLWIENRGIEGLQNVKTPWSGVDGSREPLSQTASSKLCSVGDRKTSFIQNPKGLSLSR